MSFQKQTHKQKIHSSSYKSITEILSIVISVCHIKPTWVQSLMEHLAELSELWNVLKQVNY